MWLEDEKARRDNDLRIPILDDWVDDGEEGQPQEMGWGTEKRIQFGTCYVSGICDPTKRRRLLGSCNVVWSPGERFGQALWVIGIQMITEVRK